MLQVLIQILKVPEENTLKVGFWYYFCTLFVLAVTRFTLSILLFWRETGIQEGNCKHHPMPKHFFWKTSGKGDGSHLVKQIIFSFSPCHPACGILVPLPGIKPAHPALEVWSLNHWTFGEVPQVDLRNRRVLAAIVLVFHFPFPICLSLFFFLKNFFL